jgi:hypothetical protein
LPVRAPPWSPDCDLGRIGQQAQIQLLSRLALVPETRAVALPLKTWPRSEPGPERHKSTRHRVKFYLRLWQGRSAAVVSVKRFTLRYRQNVKCSA